MAFQVMGVTAGRKDSNCEILLKEALLACREQGAEVRMINLKDYELLDCGKGEKLERCGSYTLVRPDPQAIWNTPRRHPGWKRYDARYARSHTGGGQWVKKICPAMAGPLWGLDFQY